MPKSYVSAAVCFCIGDLQWVTCIVSHQLGAADIPGYDLDPYSQAKREVFRLNRGFSIVSTQVTVCSSLLRLNYCQTPGFLDGHSQGASRPGTILQPLLPSLGREPGNSQGQSPMNGDTACWQRLSGPHSVEPSLMGSSRRRTQGGT